MKNQYSEAMIVEHARMRRLPKMPPVPLEGVVVSSPAAVVSSPEAVVSSKEVVLSVVVDSVVLVVVDAVDVVDSVAVGVVVDSVAVVVESPGAFVVVVVPGGALLEGPATAEHTPMGNSSRAKTRWLLRPMDIFCSITWNCSVTGSK